MRPYNKNENVKQPVIPEDIKTANDAYKLLKYLYKFIPIYNQLKGTYKGINLIINALGLDVNLVELWSTTDQIKNFAENYNFIRSTEVNGNNYQPIMTGKSKVANLFLTSRFDVDIIQNKNVPFENYNAMTYTIITIINQMRPVTRVLNKLYYLNRVNLDTRFCYMTECNRFENYQPLKFKYTWDLLNNPLANKNIINTTSNTVSRLIIPFIATDSFDLINNKKTTTNTYYNLYDLNIKFNNAKQKTFTFTILSKLKSETEYHKVIYSPIINKDIFITTDNNGIIIDLNDIYTTIFTDIYGVDFNLNEIGLNNLDLLLEAEFNIIPNKNYIFQ